MRCDLRGRRQQGDRHVSIHTPTWGVTGFSVRCQNQNDVSIHTPTWGVTINSFLLGPPPPFQSTHLHEVWPPSTHSFFIQLLFQSTHLHEVWRCFLGCSQSNFCFNPHTYMRCDVFYFAYFFGFFVSIHTPTWGVTFDYLISYVLILFQSTHLHEVWQFTPSFLSSFLGVSIHTPTWGVT